MIEGWVAVTHSDWFDLLARESRRQEVNFWSPSDYYAFHGTPGVALLLQAEVAAQRDRGIRLRCEL